MIGGVEVISFEKLSDIWKDYEVILAVYRSEYLIAMRSQLEDRGIPYKIFRSIERKLEEDNFTGKYEFFNRSKNKEKLLKVLAGYKEYLWDSVFARIQKYVPEDIDICVMTAGYENETLKKMCDAEGWSYLQTYENKLSLAQNLTIRVHHVAKWIYKIDEDIFITPGLFEELLDTYLFVEKEKKIEVGILAPLMVVNSYGYRRILEYEDKVADYEERFVAAVLGRGAVFSKENIARYLWEMTLPINAFAEKILNQVLNIPYVSINSVQDVF